MLKIDLSEADWRKSRYSINGNCVEFARLDAAHVGIRDSKDRDGAVLIFAVSEWAAFINGVKAGEFEV
ncbi:DUF397 domain-containing protein [Acrocarpospora catenulata]|uniref:DUF397 domain-containing protein n=1 Tax=Acrocarpospora catenulata TaxID=2836182 RepID=UPI0027DF37EE|nr:DUF397 domain-containing protein [Acrocarpospora catenulata]